MCEKPRRYASVFICSFNSTPRSVPIYGVGVGVGAVVAEVGIDVGAVVAVAGEVVGAVVAVAGALVGVAVEGFPTTIFT